ncbi:hypothetical protein KY325_02555 [Candidatus Woesearchaeota archaeon]|nr:hypothetical protein [Candidatus Woesearchaeota archaeon]
MITGCLVVEEDKLQQEQATEDEDKIMLPPPEPVIEEPQLVVEQPVPSPEPVVQEEPQIVVVDEPIAEEVQSVVEITDEIEEPIEIIENIDTNSILYTKAKGGSPSQILAGKSALKPHLINTIYTNNVLDSRGTFRMAVVDTTDKDSDLSGDRVEDVFIDFRSKEGNQFYVQEIRTDKKGTKFSHFGGVALNKMIYGDTGIDTELNPKTFAYISVWGKTDLYKNGQFFAADVPIHIAVVQGFRDDLTHNITAVDPASIEAYLVIPGIYSEEEPVVIDGLPDEFLHVYFEGVGLFKE